MKNDIALSIIIPCYNCQKTINDCVKSIIKNSYSNIEIILINDGSVDDTLNEIKNIANKYDNILVVSKDNTGVSDTRNYGIKIANGRYIGFVDSDDIICDDMFKKMIDKANDESSDIVCCDYVEKEGKILSKSKFNYDFETLSTNDAIKMFLNGKISISIWDKIFKSKIAKNNMFEKELAVGEDSLFCLKALKDSKKVSFVNEALYIYIQNENSTVHSISKKILQIDKLEKYIPQSIKKDFYDEYNYYISDCMLRCIHTLSNICNRKNFNEIKSYLLQVYSKNKVDYLIKSSNSSFFTKFEMVVLKICGITIHLHMFKVYKLVRKVIRLNG